MPDTTREAPPVDLAGLIPTPRAAEPAPAPSAVVEPDRSDTAPAAERLVFLWTALGAVAGSVVVAALFLALLTLLP